MSSSLIDAHSLSSIENNSLLLSHVRTIIKFYIWPLLVVFGLTGNCLSILVLTRRRLIRTSTNNYLTILAAFDSCYLIFTLILNFCSHPRFVSHPLSHTLTYFLRPFADFSSNTAAWLIVCFTIERTLAVVKPIYAKRTCSVRRSRHVICTLLISCFLVTLPTFFERNLVDKTYHTENKSNLSSTQTEQEHLLIKLHRIYLVLICVVIIWVPLLVICICNSILIWFVQRSCHFDDDIQSNSFYESYQNSANSINKLDSSLTPARRRSSLISACSMTNPSSFQLRRHSRPINQKRRVTIVLIVCLFVALFLWTPQSLSLTYETFVEWYAEMTYDHRILLLIFNNFANLFLCLNASIDFLLYCFLSEKFARTCKQIFFRQFTTNMIIKSPNLNHISNDRASFILANSPSTIHQQQLAANTTNKYYFQLSGFYQNPLDTKNNRHWKRKFRQSMTMNSKSEKKIFYQQNLAKDKPIHRTTHSINVLSNPILTFIDENKEIEDSNTNTLATNSAKQSRSGTLSNV